MQDMTDREIIDKLGGTVAVAKYMDVHPNVVTNWKRRGIPKMTKRLILQNRSKALRAD